MKKLLIVIGVVLALTLVGWLVATIVYSSLTAAGVKQFAEDLNQAEVEDMDLDLVSMRVDNYSKGLLSSEATTTLLMAASHEPGVIPDAMESNGQGLPLKHEIYHGPMAMTPEGAKICHSWVLSTLNRIGLTTKQDEFIRDVFGDEEPFTVRTITGFDGMTEMNIQIPRVETKIPGGEDMPEFNLKAEPTDVTLVFDQEGTRFEMSGIIGSTLSRADELRIISEALDLQFVWESGQGMAGSFKTDGMRWEDHEGFLLIGKSSVSMDLKPVWDDVPTLAGSTDYQMESIQMDLPAGRMSFNGLAFKAESGLKDEGLHSSFRIELGELELTEELKAMVPLEGLTFLEWGINGVDEEAARKMARTNMAVNQAQLDQLTAMLEGIDALDESMEELQLSPEEMDEVVEGAFGFLQPGLEMYLNLGQGPDASNLDLGINIAMQGDRPLRDHESLRGVVNALAGKVNAQLRKEALPSGIGMLLQGQIEAGLVADEGEYLSFNASMGEGAIELQGEPLNFLEGPTLMGMPLDDAEAWQLFLQGMEDAIRSAMTEP